MRSRKRLLIICFFLFLSTVVFSFFLSRSSFQERGKIYYSPPTDYLKLVSGTFRPVFAQMLFIKGVLELSEDVPDRMSYFLKLFNTVVNLDRGLLNACFFGGVVVPNKKEEIVLGIKFLKRTMSLNPSEWRIPFWIGFDYLQLGVYSKVIEYYRIASNLPDSPVYLKTNLAFYYYQESNPQEGVLYLEGLLHSLKDEHLLKVIRKKIEWLKNLVFLEEKIKTYKELYGFWPKSLNDLIKKSLIDTIPPDPFGKGYYLEQSVLGGAPKVKSKGSSLKF